MLCSTLVKLSEAATLIFLCSLATACLAWFIQYTLKPGEIFGRYGIWLNYHWIHNWRRKDRWKRAILPALGLCPYCSSVWTGTPFYLLSALALGMGSAALWLWPLFVGVQYVWIKLLGRVADD